MTIGTEVILQIMADVESELGIPCYMGVYREQMRRVYLQWHVLSVLPAQQEIVCRIEMHVYSDVRTMLFEHVFDALMRIDGYFERSCERAHVIMWQEKQETVGFTHDQNREYGAYAYEKKWYIRMRIATSYIQ